MSITRPSTEHQRAALKAKTRALVRAAGGVESAASVSRVAKSRMSDGGNPGQPDYFLPLDAVLDLELDTGQPVVTTALAQMQGYYLERIDAAPPPPTINLLRETTEASRHLGFWSGAVLSALEDGRLSDGELEDLIELAGGFVARWTQRLDQLTKMLAAQQARKDVA